MFGRYLNLCALFFAVSTVPVMLSVLFRQANKPMLVESPCDAFFHNKTYGGDHHGEGVVITTLVSEIHQSNEQHVADCIESVAVEGDHLLLEHSSNGQEVACDIMHKAYKRFNGKLKCYGFDVPIDDARRIYNDLVYRIKFIGTKLQLYFDLGLSAKEIIKNMVQFSDSLIQQKNIEDIEMLGFVQRQGKYFKKLAKSMSGLSIPEMLDFLVQENSRLFEKAKHYELLSRSGPTNKALKDQIIAHQQQLQGSRHRLFGIAGARHLDLSVNTELLAGIEPVSILMSKKLRGD